jgi:Yip1-like protein
MSIRWRDGAGARPPSSMRSRPPARSMSLPRLWLLSVTHPMRAFDALRAKPAPQWGFWIVVAFNVIISCTTLLALYLLGHGPQTPSALTFLPNERYLLAEIFFLPFLRVGVWLLASATIHLGARLARRLSDFDTILNIGGLDYLVTMPPLLLADWLLVALNDYTLSITAWTHLAVTLWGAALTAAGLLRLLRLPLPLALGLAALSVVVSIPLLAIFAR